MTLAGEELMLFISCLLHDFVLVHAFIKRTTHVIICFVLFDLILYVHSTIFQLCGTGLPGLNQY